jgi:glycosyltransferase involved in cell wall biosynthesis
MAHPPLLEGTAAGRCAVALLEGLAAHGVDCHVLCPQRGGEPLPTSLGGLGVDGVGVEGAGEGEGIMGAGVESMRMGSVRIEAVPRPRVPAAQLRRDRLLRPMGTLARGPFGERVRVLAGDADVVHFVEMEAGMAIAMVNRPAVVQLHCLTRRDPRVWNPMRAQGRISIELLRGERRVRHGARWLLVNSAEVGRQLAQLAPQAKVVAAPLALDPDHYEPRAALDAPRLGLIGTARWPPTGRAIERLLRRVWPLVREQRPDAELLLAGEGMERSAFGDLADQGGVRWLGQVPSATEFLRTLGVLLYPLTAGSGVKVKVLEALALGIPVITTPEGAEGLGARGGVIVEHEDRRLAAAAVRLCADRQARLAAGAEAYRTFIDHHSPYTAAAPVVELYERMRDAP